MSNNLMNLTGNTRGASLTVCCQRVIRLIEAVEKVPKQILERDAEKSDLIEYAMINDLMPGKGQVTPENHPLIVVRGFSTGSLG